MFGSGIDLVEIYIDQVIFLSKSICKLFIFHSSKQICELVLALDSIVVLSLGDFY